MQARQDGLEQLLWHWLEELAAALLFWLPEANIQQLVAAFGKQTSEFNKKQFHRVLKSVYGVDIFTHESWLESQLKLFEAQNIALIKSIPTQLHDKLRYRFVEAVRKGERWEQIAADIESLLSIPQKRAKLIARDQIGKLNGQLTQLRQQQVGVTHYIWRTMLDERVRDSHQEREGEQFAWDSPPDDGHPQQPILCRCYAEPVLPEFEDVIEAVQSPYYPKAILTVVDTKSVGQVSFTEKQLQKKFSHAIDFGIVGNSQRANWVSFQQAIIAHLNHSKTFEYGVYRGHSNQKVYYNYETHLAVVVEDGRFLTAFKPKKDSNQMQNYMKNGNLY